jgi:tetratricopeptide (TPR) repeat protein/TolB-like protein
VFCSRARASRSQITFLLVALGILTTACSRKDPPALQRLAILRFENLTGDDALNWMGRAVSEIMSAELAGSRTTSVVSPGALRTANRLRGARPSAAPGISSEQDAALLSGATRILYGRVSQIGGRLRVDAALFDTASQKIERSLSATASVSDGVIRLADSLAKELAASVRPFDTQNPEALRQYCAGIESPDAIAAGQAFSRAVDADPNFGEAYVAWALLAARQSNREETARILALASVRGNAIAELERARLAAIDAELRGDLTARTRALETIGRLDPTDYTLYRQLAQVNLNARNYAKASENLKAAVALEPNDISLLNQLGYAEMYAGNLAEATKALDEYERLRPTDPNAPDSLGDVHFSLGQFTQAEKFYRQSFDKDGNFNNGGALMKAAWARLMTGDTGGADGIFNRYLDTRRNAKDPGVEFRGAEWEFLTGRRRQAITRMEAFARSLPVELAPVMAPQAYAQLAVWELELGDRTHARGFALKAAGTHGSGPAFLARFLTEAPARPSEWSARARQGLPEPPPEQTRKTVLAYALLLQREFQAAEPILRDLYQHSTPDPQEILPVFLAWAQVETGHFEDAARFVQRNPVPNVTPDFFASLAFPRLLFVRAAVLEKQAQRDAAVNTYRLFLALSGPEAKAFGEEAKARQATGK